mmetsp:Transcript_26567/g.78584  ORF Transcript_26567/g.78584 Transcript_26567/m.78584 type:complete len:90 (+) Transcript_26567:348-617(+)
MPRTSTTVVSRVPPAEYCGQLFIDLRPYVGVPQWWGGKEVSQASGEVRRRRRSVSGGFNRRDPAQVLFEGRRRGYGGSKMRAAFALVRR